MNSVLEQALIDAMNKALTIDTVNDMTTDDDDDDDVDFEPTEKLQVSVHEFNNSHENHIRIVLDDFLVESLIYRGSDQLGDQAQYGLTPMNENLSLSFDEMFVNAWIEFVIGADGTSTSIWLRTDHIYMCENLSFPLNIELIDEDYFYVVRATVIQKNATFYFTNLFIQTIN